MSNDTHPVNPEPTRKAISRRLRFEILRRDGHTCRYCGAQAPDVTLMVDHVVPRALGGPDTPDNLVTACQPCNSGKGSTSPDDTTLMDVEAHEQRWREAMREAADHWLGRRISADAQIDEVRAVWDSWTMPNGDTLPIEGDWRQSVLNWLNAGLDVEHIVRMIPAAMTHPNIQSTRWRYFCWTVWRAIDEIQAEARNSMEGDA